MIKFLDLYKQDKNLHKSILNKIDKLFKKGDFILGNEVSSFEKNFSKFSGSKYAIGCANGTDALTMALSSLDLPRNSEVIIPAMTYCSTAFSVLKANLKPILVDTDFLKSTISIDELKKKITKKTKVILPVHLYGSVANLTEIKKIIGNKKIYLIDDCAQAHGAFEEISNKRIKKKIGSIADISCFSLYPGTSRSGICITAARFLGFDRESAAKFSLLLSIPAILGAAVLEGYDLVKLNDYELNLNLLTATILSFAFSLASITFMMSWIKKYSFTPFIIYRLLLGVLLLLAIYFW